MNRWLRFCLIVGSILISISARATALPGDPYFAVDVFNWRYYIQANPDLQKAGILTEAQARQHWQNYGINECRQAHPGFHTSQYLNARGNSDIKAAYGTCARALYHYVNWGRDEHYRLLLVEKVAPEYTNCTVPTGVYFVRQKNSSGAAEMIRYETYSANPPLTYAGRARYVSSDPIVRHSNSSMARFAAPSHAQNCTLPYSIAPGSAPPFDRSNPQLTHQVKFRLRTEGYFQQHYEGNSENAFPPAGNHFAVLLRTEFWGARWRWNGTQLADPPLENRYPEVPQTANPASYRARGAIFLVGAGMKEEYYSTYEAGDLGPLGGSPLKDNVTYDVIVWANQTSSGYRVMDGSTVVFSTQNRRWTARSGAVSTAGTGLGFAALCDAESCQFADQRQFGVYVSNIQSSWLPSPPSL
jgi:hypothetical protein